MAQARECGQQPVQHRMFHRHRSGQPQQAHPQYERKQCRVEPRADLETFGDLAGFPELVLKLMQRREHACVDLYPARCRPGSNRKAKRDTAEWNGYIERVASQMV